MLDVSALERIRTKGRRSRRHVGLNTCDPGAGHGSGPAACWTSSGPAVVCWRHLEAAVGQAPHSEREERGAHGRPGLPPSLGRGCEPRPLRENPSMILWLHHVHSPCGRWGGLSFRLTPPSPLLAPFLWLPSALERSPRSQATKPAFLASPQPPCASAEPEPVPEQAILRTHPQAFARAVPSICNTLPRLSPTSLTPPLGLGVDPPPEPLSDSPGQGHSPVGLLWSLLCPYRARHQL